jgi:hypothetical protein
MEQRKKEAEETKKKHHQTKPKKSEPTMLELVTAKVENVQSGKRLNSNPNLGFTLSTPLTQKITKLNDLLLDANLVSKNDSGKIFKLEASAKECINFIRELGEQ